MFENLLEYVGSNYSELPLQKKREFWCIIDHLLRQDNNRFERLRRKATQWATKDSGAVKIMCDEGVAAN